MKYMENINKTYYTVVLDYTIGEVFTYKTETNDIVAYLESKHNLNNCEYMTAFEPIQINTHE